MNILFLYHLLPAPGEGFINCDLILRAPRLHLWRFTTACAVLRVCMCDAPRLYVPCFASVCKDANLFFAQRVNLSAKFWWFQIFSLPLYYK